MTNRFIFQTPSYAAQRLNTFHLRDSRKHSHAPNCHIISIRYRRISAHKLHAEFRSGTDIRLTCKTLYHAFVIDAMNFDPWFAIRADAARIE